MIRLVLLHGYNGSENDWKSDQFDLPRNVDIIRMRAPMPVSQTSYAWCRVKFTSSGPSDNGRDAKKSLDWILAQLSEMHALANDGPTYLLGFSQGAAMALEMALAKPEWISGVVSISGQVFQSIRRDAFTHAKCVKVPILMLHGKNDRVVPLSRMVETRDKFVQRGANVECRILEMAHEITDACCKYASEWLRGQMNKGDS